MPVFKNKTQGQYVNVYKDILKNHSLSLRDRGMVVTLLSLPDNWEFTISGLSKIIPDGKSSIRASLTHLEELGYISRTQERAECGKFGKIAIEIHETPIAPLSDIRKTEKATADNPSTGKPLSEKRTQYINNQLNNNQGLDFLIPSLLFMKGALIDNQRSSNKFAASGNRSALRLPGSFRRRGFQSDHFMETSL